MIPTIQILKNVADLEFHSIVKTSYIINYKLRIILIDDSYIDVNVSSKISGKFGFHWETRNAMDEIYRYDNFPDINWKEIDSFPYHFHNGSQSNVISSPFPKEIIPAFNSFMNFVKEKIEVF